MPTYYSFAKASGQYAVIILYKDDPKVEDLKKFLKNQGWTWNGTETPWKPRGWLNSILKKDWAIEFCNDPIKVMTEIQAKEKAIFESKEKEEIARCGGYWEDFSESQKDSRITAFYKNNPCCYNLTFANRYLSLISSPICEVKFLGIVFTDSEWLRLRFWESSGKLYSDLYPIYIRLGEKRVRVIYGNNKTYKREIVSSSYFSDYTRDRKGSLSDILLSKKLLISTNITIEIIYALRISLNITRSQKLTINISHNQFDAFLNSDNNFEPESDINLSGNNSYNFENSNDYWDFKNISSCYEGSDFITDTWAEESILKEYGYTVSKRENLSETERHNIIMSVINDNAMTKTQVINHLESLINLRRYQSKYNLAISKWNADIDYIKKHF